MIRRIIIGSTLALATVALLPVVRNTLRPLVATGIREAKSTLETIKEEMEDIVAEAKLERMQKQFDKELAESDIEIDQTKGKSATIALVPKANSTLHPLVDAGVKSVKSTFETIKEEVRMQKQFDKEPLDIEQESISEQEVSSTEKITNEQEAISKEETIHVQEFNNKEEIKSDS
ncbi:hypothetical protein [Aneurinibacillus aneurinilyticus]|jgi:frataxin-like iron-binding protein CyaY|uniref:DUF5132 domain-containing protein n=1 Tax=Aneurinibacillus aneurinilyticus ATCC 12856 TaxID=649747 RepID=U1WX75_ANEAE|nr:hypothetical protein [Aneurinibacillus aneurinilyticus]ERI06838.1 hypothetical protein HMPREF0083_05080 [Aneurinibacillus aneurinilyticus ATCC 12856]MCI1695577.1 hypothetical protein [Aneurinibacillus aneurinilyticus]MED0705516.1 hypothetical protein [Aneurinibacillus aneurinilyticus]MED0722957.1 hypothetical protein [Aneurinibacillus aneurinilyticus]MED0732363.1 hypothetical protein [Aneurinibacillus aneurinilyticus]